MSLIFIKVMVLLEVHEWFKVINIAGKPLTAQEFWQYWLIQALWLSDAKL